VPAQINVDGSEMNQDLWVTAIGVTWDFPNKGMRSKSGGETFVSQKDGAIIKFIKKGLRLDGIEKHKK
jgi:hypothetical protein